MSTQRALHPELWIIIASHLPNRQSLALLCRTSSSFLQLARPLLYRKVKLWDRQHDTIKLLSSDNNLAHNVQIFTLRISSYELEREGNIWAGDPGLQDRLFDVLTSMNSLRKLSLPLSICLKMMHNPARCQKFLDHFNSRKSPLHSFSGSNTIPIPSFSGLPNGCALSRLTVFRWDDYNDEIGQVKDIPFVWDILRASRETLQDICLEFAWPASRNIMWEMRFPRLRRLSLPLMEYTRTIEDDSEGMGKFLGVHPSVEELDFSLGWGDHRGETFADHEFQDLLAQPRGLLSTEFLPNLRIFSGPLNVFVRLARYRPGCLRTLSHLELMIPMFCSSPDIIAMLHLLLKEGMPRPLLPALKDFKTGIERRSVSDYRAVYAKFAELFGPSVEIWRIDEVEEMWLPVKVMAPIFACFENLREIHMEHNVTNRRMCFDDEFGEDVRDDDDDEQVQQDSTQIAETYVRKLAHVCRKLQKVVMFKYRVLEVFGIERVYANGSEEICVHVSDSTETRIFPGEEWEWA